MGTTVTTNLGLIKPDADESIKEDLPQIGWAAQNAINCDKIDSVFRFTSHSYVPAWTAPTTNPTLGAGGFVEGKYLRVSARMVMVHFRIYAGVAGFNPGSGIYNLTLPAAAPVAAEFATFTGNADMPLGKASFLDASAVLTSNVFTVFYNKTSNLLYFKTPNTIIWSNVAPVTLATDDRMSGYIMYPTSAV